MNFIERIAKIKFKDVLFGEVIRDQDGGVFLKINPHSSLTNTDVPANAVDLVDGSLHKFDDDFVVELVCGRFVECGVDLAKEADKTVEVEVECEIPTTEVEVEYEIPTPKWLIDSEPQYNVETKEELEDWKSEVKAWDTNAHK